MKEIIITQENVIAAYQAANDEQKKLLIKLFPDVPMSAVVEPEGYVRQQDKTIPVEERIYTFEDAILALGDENRLVCEFRMIEQNSRMAAVTLSADIMAYLKLRIVCAALNDGWEPEFTEDEERWYPWHLLWMAHELNDKDDKWEEERALMSTAGYKGDWAGFASANSNGAPSNAAANLGSRLCLKDESTARLAATRFIDLWADFKLIRSEEAAPVSEKAI